MSRPDHRGKRRKIGHNGESDDFDTSKPSARFAPLSGGREWTVSVAIPGSVVADHRTLDQRMTSPGRIARALAVFSIDEVVVYDDMPPGSGTNAGYDGSNHSGPRHNNRQHGHQSRSYHHQDAESSFTADVDPCHFLTHLLSYLEAPPFMRKTLFPIHPNLRLAGLLPSLDMPHHPNPIDAALPYREGVTIDRKPSSGAGTLVDIGGKAPVELEDDIPAQTRVTVHLPEGETASAEAVHPAAPREEGGYYWGYSVRRAASLSAVFEEAPFEDGYDLSIGTSERGDSIGKAFPDYRKTLGFKHLLIVLGGPKGIEFAASNDEQLQQMGVAGGKIKQLFDHWINVLPGQGSRTIRTDEAAYIALTGLRRLWDAN